MGGAGAKATGRAPCPSAGGAAAEVTHVQVPGCSELCYLHCLPDVEVTVLYRYFPSMEMYLQAYRAKGT